MTLTTVPDKAFDDVFTESMWDDSLKTNINELIGRSAGNLLVNGGFEIWQRGTGPFTADLAYTADRWQMDEGAGSAIQIDREASIVDANSRYSLKLVYTHSTNSELRQRVEDGYQLRGKTIALSVRVRATTSDSITLGIRTNGSGGTSDATAYTLIANTWMTLDITHACNSDMTYAEVYITCTTAITLYLDNAMLVIGPNATEYVPLHPQEELARCQRYYEVHNSFDLRCYSTDFFNYGVTFPVTFQTQKGGTPTVTKNGTWGIGGTAANLSQPSILNASVHGYMILVGASAASTGHAQYTTNSSDDTITAEWNP